MLIMLYYFVIIVLYNNMIVIFYINVLHYYIIVLLPIGPHFVQYGDWRHVVRTVASHWTPFCLTVESGHP